MLLTAMHDNPNQGFWQANAKNNPPAIIKESTVSPDKRMILFCMCFENQSGSVAQILPQKPERQRDAHARHSRYATDADQQEIVVHNNYQDACPSA